MIHIATVHWKDSRWIDAQLNFVRRHIPESYRVYAWLNDVPGDHKGRFYYSTTEPVVGHATKLNILADIIYFDSDRDRDLLVFLDGDAFPIGDAIGFARQRLERQPLVAVQRRENNRDIQPHPCFCVTTVGFWKNIGGDWKAGHTWLDCQQNLVTDVGGNLLGILERHGLSWCPMLRSNRTNLHPVCFGVYEDVVYHHGAGFRDPWTRHDDDAARSAIRWTWRWPVVSAIDRLSSCYNPDSLLQRIRVFVLEKPRLLKLREMSQNIYEMIVRDEQFHRAFA
jgi:hypothetical protein